MRIGMLTDVYKPHVSGITNYISLNKRMLEKAGHEVYIFTFGDLDYADDESNVIRSPGLAIVDTGFYLSLRYNRRARRMLYTMDIAHVHHPFLSGSLALRYCRPRDIPIIFTNHTRYDLYTQAYFPMLPDTVGEAAMKAYLPPFCRACDLIIAPSSGMAQVLVRFGVDAPIEVVPNGVALEPLRAQVTPMDRAELGARPEDVLLIYVGRVAPEKNLSFLLRAFAGVAEAFENVHLVIAGDGPAREELVEQARHLNTGSRIHFTGMVPYEELPRYLAAADAFVTASVTEVHPLSVIEAMATGLPVLGITSPGVGDTVQDGKTGFLASDDLAAFTAKMARLVSEHELRLTMGQAAYQTAELYDIRRTTKLMLERYQRLVSQSQGRKRGLRYRVARLFDRWR